MVYHRGKTGAAATIIISRGKLQLIFMEGCLGIIHKRILWLDLPTWKLVKIRAYEYGPPLNKEGEKMNKKASQKKVILLTVILCFTLILSACDTTSQKIRYYSDRSNYMDATGIIERIVYEKDYIYLQLTELTADDFDGNGFEIVGENLSIVKEKGIKQKIALGNQIEFVSAPKYFGDGHGLPIVEITVDGETLLEFEEGYANLLKWLYDSKS